MDDYDEIINLCRSFNRKPQEVVAGPRAASNGVPGDERPGDDFNRRADWQQDVLGPHGWTIAGQVGEKCYWRRPGKEGRGWSATTGFCRSEASGDLLYVFSTNAKPFESEKAYSKFAAFTILSHDGDFARAAESLRLKGYGKQPPTIQFTASKKNGIPDPIPSPRSGEQGTESQPEPNPLGVKLVSQLDRGDEKSQWLWHGYLCLNGITLFSALWKAGKTTLLAHLMKALASDGLFCGLRVKASQVLYVSEEHESRWAERRDSLGLLDPLRFIIRPFAQKPTMDQWIGFLKGLQEYCQSHPVQLIVFDTLSNLWPVKDENDAARVQEALMPLHAVGNNIAFLLVHHLRKNDGHEATGARGSGALPAFVDTRMELRRYNASDRKDTRRVLTGYGRYEETVDEMVIELKRDPLSYVAHGDKQQVAALTSKEYLLDHLPRTVEEAKTKDQLYNVWDSRQAPKPGRNDFIMLINEGCKEGLWAKTGKGVKGDPERFWVPPADSIPCTSSLRDRTESECPFGDVSQSRDASDAQLVELLVYLRDMGPLTSEKLASLSNREESAVKADLFQLWEERAVSKVEESGVVTYSFIRKEDRP